MTRTTIEGDPPVVVITALNAVGFVDGDFVQARQAVTLRVDRTNDELTLWRNGEPVDQTGNGDLTGIDELVTSANKIKIGAGQACPAVLWHKRLLSDTEIGHLHGLLV